MAVTLGSNISSLKAQAKLANGSSALGRAFERLASGSRINRASDDAAGLAISTSLNAGARIYQQGIRNLNDGISYLNIGEKAISQLSGITIRQLELASQAANGVYSQAQRGALNAEANALAKEFNRIIESTNFNGRSLLDVLQGSQDVRMQGGFGLNGSISVGIGSQARRIIGDGSFQSGTLVSGTGRTAGTATADINGDGILDILTGDFARVVVSLGNGDGTFQAATSTATVGMPGPSTAVTAIAITDYNGDGRNDLVYGREDGQVVYQLGLGDGTFGSATTLGVGGSITHILTGDLNHDGISDIVVKGSSSSVAVRLGSGSGTFSVTSSVNFGSAPADIALVDMNDDGYLDIIAANENNDSIDIALGRGNGRFNARTSYSTGTGGSSPNRLVVGDFDNDGRKDVAYASWSDDSLYLMAGLAGGQLATAQLIDSAVGVTRLVVGDFNGDGKQDLGFANATTSLSVMRGGGDNTFGAIASYARTGSVNALNTLLLGDFNRDGVTDLIGLNNVGHANMAVFAGNTTYTTTTKVLNLNTAADARDMISFLNEQLTRLSAEQGLIGAYQSRLEVALSNLASTSLNYLTSASRIKDADIAQESAELSRQQILQQTAASVLAQANQQPALALTLLRN